jgi:hypothetical protein
MAQREEAPMNWKSTGILLTAAAVLFAFIWLVERPIRQEHLRQASRIVLPGLDPGIVNSVAIKPHNADEIIARRMDGTNAGWQLIQPISYPAQNAPIQALLDALTKLEWQDRISAGELKDQPDAQDKFGFTQPQFEVALHGTGVSDKILIGQSSALGDQVFLEVVGNPDIYLINTTLLQSIPWDKDQWRNTALLDPARLQYQSIQVRSPGRGFELERDPTNHLWIMKQPVTARADNDRINELIGRLQGLRVQQFVSDDSRADLELYGLQTSPQTPELDLTFWQGTNLTAELQVGSSPTNQPGLAFARRQDPSNVVVIPREPLRPWQGAYTNFLDYHFISVSPESIYTIVVQGEDRFSVQKQTNGQWQVRAGTTFPADAELMHDWLASFTNIQTQIEKTVATDIAVYGLTHPLLQYSLQGSGGSNTLIAQIEFGVNKAGKIFERRPDERRLDESSVNLVSPDDFDRLPRAAWQLRDRGIWNFDSSNVVSLTIHQLGATRKYLRDPEGEWTFAPGYHGPPLVNWPSLEEGVYRLGKLRAVYWSGVGNAHGREFGFTKMDFNISVEVKRNDQVETYSIEFGGRSPYSYPYAAVVRNGQRLIFEFPVDLYENFVEHDMTIPAARQNPP